MNKNKKISNRPNNLIWPCSSCDKWKESEYKVDEEKAKLFWDSSEFYINACEYDPRYANPFKDKNCPYKPLFLQSVPVLEVCCDFCGKKIGMYLANAEIMGMNFEKMKQIPQLPPPDLEDGEGLYICDKCLVMPSSDAIREKVLKNNPKRTDRINWLLSERKKFEAGDVI